MADSREATQMASHCFWLLWIEGSPHPPKTKFATEADAVDAAVKLSGILNKPVNIMQYKLLVSPADTIRMLT